MDKIASLPLTYPNHRRAWGVLGALALAALFLPIGRAQARRKRATGAAAGATVSTTAVTDRAVSGEAPPGGRRPMAELLGKFKWQMSPDEVITLLSTEIRERYQPQVEAAASDAIKQDLLRKQASEEIDQLKKSYVSFNGVSSGWDVSLVDREFVQKNSESMVVHWQEGHKRRMFFFFVDQQLWKIFIAFSNANSALEGKSFDKFVSLLEARYGAAAPKFREAMRGEAKLDYVEWQPSGRELLQAVDHTTLYGNYCLRIMDTRVNSWIAARREKNSPEIQRRDSIVDAATKKSTVEGDANENVVDRITGRHPTGGPRPSPAGNPVGNPAASPSTEEPPADSAPEPAAEPAPGKRRPSGRSGRGGAGGKGSPKGQGGGALDGLDL